MPLISFDRISLFFTVLGIGITTILLMYVGDTAAFISLLLTIGAVVLINCASFISRYVHDRRRSQ